MSRENDSHLIQRQPLCAHAPQLAVQAEGDAQSDDNAHDEPNRRRLGRSEGVHDCQAKGAQGVRPLSLLVCVSRGEPPQTLLTHQHQRLNVPLVVQTDDDL